MLLKVILYLFTGITHILGTKYAFMYDKDPGAHDSFINPN